MLSNLTLKSWLLNTYLHPIKKIHVAHFLTRIWNPHQCMCCFILIDIFSSCVTKFVSSNSMSHYLSGMQRVSSTRSGNRPIPCCYPFLPHLTTASGVQGYEESTKKQQRSQGAFGRICCLSSMELEALPRLFELILQTVCKINIVFLNLEKTVSKGLSQFPKAHTTNEYWSHGISVLCNGVLEYSIWKGLWCFPKFKEQNLHRKATSRNEMRLKYSYTGFWPTKG